MKVAVTTTEGKKIDQHFGAADAFHVYELEDGKAVLLEVRRIPEEWIKTYRTELGERGCNGENKGYITQVARMLGDCQYVLTAKIGPRLYKALVSKGISCIELVGEVQEILSGIGEFQNKREYAKGKVKEGKIRIAAASTNGQRVDQHFGCADQFYVYEVSQENMQFLEIRKHPERCGGRCGESLRASADLLEDCYMIMASRIGPGAWDYLTERGFKIVETQENISDAIKKNIGI